MAAFTTILERIYVLVATGLETVFSRPNLSEYFGSDVDLAAKRNAQKGDHDQVMALITPEYQVKELASAPFLYR